MSSPVRVDSDTERENDLEVIIENDGNEEVEQVEAQSDNENKENEEAPKVVKPKRIVRNPRPTLNVEVLRGPKGLTCLENYFKNIKFKGNGHEAEDLRTIMKTYEYWCHRLFPKYPFDQCLGKIEQLGAKKNLQTYLKRIRLGMEDFGASKPDVSDEEEKQDGVNDAFSTASPPREDTSITPTEEQLERMRLNRERALKLRMERLQRIQEAADSLMSKPSTSRSSVGEENEMLTNDN